jgi:hypothetical protein
MLRLAALAATLAALTAPVDAAPYTLFIYEDPGQLALRPASGDAAAAYWGDYDAFGKALAAAGVLRGGSALTTGAPVALVGAGDGDAGTPVARSGLPLGGYFQIDVATDAEALAWAAKVPTAGTGLVEVRAGYPVPGMSM